LSMYLVQLHIAPKTPKPHSELIIKRPLNVRRNQTHFRKALFLLFQIKIANSPIDSCETRTKANSPKSNSEDMIPTKLTASFGAFDDRSKPTSSSYKVTNI